MLFYFFFVMRFGSIDHTQSREESLKKCKRTPTGLRSRGYGNAQEAEGKLELPAAVILVLPEIPVASQEKLEMTVALPLEVGVPLPLIDRIGCELQDDLWGLYWCVSVDSRT